jgi:antitoxin (DNA-binding transcriptional repressor) of toxin-antitoxin stability system
MGDLPLRVWTESGALMGDVLTAQGDRELLWEVAPGSEVTIFVADRPVAHLAPSDQARGVYRLQGNGPHWLLAKRGLAWAVSSPVWVQNQPADAAAGRARLAQESALAPAVDRLRRRLDWLQARQTEWNRSALPVAAYVDWLQGLLPQAWPDTDWGWEPGRDPAAIAQARLAAAMQIATPLLTDVIRSSAVQQQTGTPAPRVIITAQEGGAPGGLVQFTVDVPRDWAAIQLCDEIGTLLPHLAQAVDGQRDPIDSLRTRVQVEEIYVWLAHGEMHEYVLRDLRVLRQGSTLTIQIDLYPEELGLQARPDPAAAEALAAQVADPGLTQIFVHLRMPRRFALVLEIEALQGAESRTLLVQEAMQDTGQDREPGAGQSAAPLPLSLAALDRLDDDPAQSAIVVQVG